MIILNWNGAEDTWRCFNSVQPHLEMDDYIFIVDNGSTDGSPDLLASRFNDRRLSHGTGATAQLPAFFDPECRIYLVSNNANLGFGGGNNAVLKAIGKLRVEFTHVWLVNNDVVADANTLAGLKAKMAVDPAIAAAGSLILNYPDDSLIQCSAVKHYKWLGVSKLINKNKPLSVFRADSNFDFDYLNGASLMFDYKSIKELGFFDERFFLYSEEYDLQLRLKEKGSKLAFAPRSLARHQLSNSTSGRKHLFYYYYNASALLLSRKHFAKIVTLCASLALVGITFVRSFPQLKDFVWGLKGIVKGLKTA